jgi:hypothetical protein
VPLNVVLAAYTADIAAINSFIVDIHATYRNGRHKRTLAERAFVTESAFLKMFIAWESMLEAAFLEYMMGSPSTRGTIVPRYVHPTSKSHANSILMGTLPHVKWSNRDSVKKLSELYFLAPNPFVTQLSSIHTELEQLNTVRNASAHLSSTTSQKLDNVCRNVLGRTFSSNKVYSFLTSADPMYPPDSILDIYQQKLLVAVNGICSA